MNWDAIAALGELTAAFAVLVSIFYLSVQVRTARIAVERETKRQTILSTASANNQFQHLRDLVISDGELAEIVERGVSELSSLSKTELRRFDAYLRSWIMAFGVYHRQQSETAYMDDDVKNTYKNIIERQFNGPGFNEWWRGYGMALTDEVIENLINDLLDTKKEEAEC